ncbi:MAG: AAA family ATPase [Betaproteobacteria bacterium]|nr:AAA family ATPase [Betaproteobacteria bacterium]
MPNRGWTRIPLTEASRESLPPIEFCVPNLMAGSVGVVAAPTGIGKTCLLMQIGAAVAAGIPVANGAIRTPERTGRVVMLAAEDPPPVLGRRAQQLVKSLDMRSVGRDAMALLENNFEFLSLHGPAPKILSETWEKLLRVTFPGCTQ